MQCSLIFFGSTTVTLGSLFDFFLFLYRSLHCKWSRLGLLYSFYGVIKDLRRENRIITSRVSC
jgi:hypothetical protein